MNTCTGTYFTLFCLRNWWGQWRQSMSQTFELLYIWAIEKHWKVHWQFYGTLNHSQGWHSSIQQSFFSTSLCVLSHLLLLKSVPSRQCSVINCQCSNRLGGEVTPFCQNIALYNSCPSNLHCTDNSFSLFDINKYELDQFCWKCDSVEFD